MNNAADSGSNSGVRETLVRRAVLYPNHYCWFVFFSALDIMLTHAILHGYMEFNGRELNTFADFVIRQAGLNGAIGLKMASIIIVILVCEYVGRRKPATGRTLAICAVAMSTVPVLFAMVQLSAVRFGWIDPVPS